MVDIFQRFTDRARRTTTLAREEANLMGHDYIGTEHLLLGLIQEGEAVAAVVLRSLGIELEAVRAEVEKIVGPSKQKPPSPSIAFTARAKKVLELSLREALQLGHNHIGTEHILLGLVREGEGVAAKVLVALGADLSSVRKEVIRTLGGYTKTCFQKPEPIADPLPALTRSARKWLDAMQVACGNYVDKSWPGENIMHATLGLTEEAGEVSRAVLKREHGTRGTAEQWTTEIRKEAADTMLCLLDVARREGFSLADAVLERFVVILDRPLDHDPVGSDADD